MAVGARAGFASRTNSMIHLLKKLLSVPLSKYGHRNLDIIFLGGVGYRTCPNTRYNNVAPDA